MGKVLYLEPVGGIAGDMFLAAGIDLGLSPDALTQALSGLGVPGWKLAVKRAVRHAISGTHLDVLLDEREAHPSAHRGRLHAAAPGQGAGPGGVPRHR
jgi:pyridinium-3,5-bisthiocarboxylic acid mononucleotide nickel chelatase